MPPALNASTVCWTSFTFAPTARRGVNALDAVSSQAVSPSLNVPSGSFMSFVRWKSPEESDTIATPRLGQRLPGTAKPTELSDLSPNSRAFSKRSSFWFMDDRPAGFHRMPSGSSATATLAEPKPSERAFE